MHRQTIDAYDAGAQHWRDSRRGTADGTELPPVATAFRQRVGAGLILDLGCGPGVALPALGHPVVGVDASLGMLSIVDRAAGFPLVAGDIEALPFRHGCASGAFASFSFQHLPRAQFFNAVGEVAKLLRPEGLLELLMHATPGSDGVRENDDMGIGRWFTYWSSAELEGALPRSGFKILAIEDRGFARRTLAQVDLR